MVKKNELKKKKEEKKKKESSADKILRESKEGSNKIIEELNQEFD